MKKIDFKKIIILFSILIILLGTVIVLKDGFTKSFEYGKYKKVEIQIGEFDKNKIENIAKSVFENKKVEINEVEYFGNIVAINVSDITDEEIEELVQIINKEYNLEYTKENINILDISAIRLRDLIKPYISAFIISLILILAYAIIIFRKKSAKAILFLLLSLIFTQLLYISIVIIFKIAITSTVIGFSIFIFMATLLVTLNNLQKNIN